jgi:hypothetical protein
MQRYYKNRYYNRYDHDISKPFRLFASLGQRLIFGTAIIIGLNIFINSEIKTLSEQNDPDFVLAPITNYYIQNAAISLYSLHLSLVFWWGYTILQSIYYYLRPETIYSLSNQEIRSKGLLNPFWTEILPFLLSLILPHFFF